MVRNCGVIVGVVLLAAACGGSDAATTTEAAARGVSTTAAATSVDEEPSTTITAPPQENTSTAVSNAFDQLVYERYLLIEMALYNTATEEWSEGLPPSAAVADWYCTGEADPYRNGWSWTWDGDPPALMDDYQAWNDEFWGLADEYVCRQQAAESSQAAAGGAPADLVPFFYPGFELTEATILDPTAGSPARIVATSTSTPGFRIVFDASLGSAGASGCDFVDEATGNVWCHSTAPGGLEAFAGRSAMLPQSQRPSIEAAVEPDGLLITYFGLVSNVEIVLRGILPESLAAWDGASFDKEISFKLDLAGGIWQRQ